MRYTMMMAMTEVANDVTSTSFPCPGTGRNATTRDSMWARRRRPCSPPLL